MHSWWSSREWRHTPLEKPQHWAPSLHPLTHLPPPIYLPTYPHTCSSYPLFFHSLFLCFIPTNTPIPTRDSVFLLSSLEETVYHFLLKSSSPFKFLVPSLGLLKAQILALHPVVHTFCCLSISHRVETFATTVPPRGIISIVPSLFPEPWLCFLSLCHH